MFAPDNVKKVSYSTSFGVSEIPQRYTNDAQKFLSRFEYISVREKSGQTIVKEIAQRDAALVCDPTMLLSNDQWREIIPPKRIVDEPYIFCYFLGKNKAHRQQVEKLKEKTTYQNMCDARKEIYSTDFIC